MDFPSACKHSAFWYIWNMHPHFRFLSLYLLSVPCKEQTQLPLFSLFPPTKPYLMRPKQSIISLGDKQGVWVGKWSLWCCDQIEACDTRTREGNWEWSHPPPSAALWVTHAVLSSKATALCHNAGMPPWLHELSQALDSTSIGQRGAWRHKIEDGWK